MWHYSFPHYWILVTTWYLVFGHLLLHAKFTLDNYHYSLKYWPVGAWFYTLLCAWHVHTHCLSTGQWVLESHNGRRDDSETSPFQSCPTINPKSPQQEWNGRQRSISRVFCRSHRVQMSQISLCKVSQFLAPVSLFRARAKARISIECGSFECGSVRVRGRIRRIWIAAYRARGPSGERPAGQGWTVYDKERTNGDGDFLASLPLLPLALRSVA